MQRSGLKTQVAGVRLQTGNPVFGFWVVSGRVVVREFEMIFRVFLRDLDEG